MSRRTLDNAALFERLQLQASEAVHALSADIVLVFAIQRDNVAAVIADHKRPNDDPETRRIVARELRAFLTQLEANDMPPEDPKPALDGHDTCGQVHR